MVGNLAVEARRRAVRGPAPIDARSSDFGVLVKEGGEVKNGVPIMIAGVEIMAAIAECATAVLDGKPETKPDLNRLLSRILAAFAGANRP